MKRDAHEELFEIDLFKLLNALLHHVWLVVLAALICGVIGFSYASYRITPMYQSSILLYVNTSTISVGRTSISMADLSLSKSLVDTYIVILKTRLTR